MGESGRFDGEIELPGGSFSRLLFATDDAEHSNFLMYPSSSPPPLFSSNTPKMLCFGDFASEKTTQPTLSTKPILLNPPLSHSHKRRNGSGQEPGKVSEKKGGAKTGNQTEKKKKKNKQEEAGPTTRTKTPSAGHAKRRREKLGERIATLQQLVSPYGKTDTASVLHEAMGYIRFLQEQVKVLSSPYLERLPLPSSSAPHHLSGKEEGNKKEPTKGLGSRGLCLMPVQCLAEIGSPNGADFWHSTP